MDGEEEGLLCIRSAISKVVDGCPERLVRRPRCQFPRHAHVPLLQRNAVVRDIVVEVRWDQPVAERIARLDDGRDPADRLRVSDVGLRRAHNHGIIGWPTLAECTCQRLGFDGIAHGRASHLGHISAADRDGEREREKKR